MKIILMRHADRAYNEGVAKRDQPLTPSGEKKTRLVADRIARHLGGERIDSILASSWRGPADTAQVLRGIFSPDEFLVTDILVPGVEDRPEAVIAALRERSARSVSMLVGHIPLMADLVLRFTSASVAFELATACCVETNSVDEAGALCWTVDPRSFVV